MSVLTWEELDACNSADEIYFLLRRNGIKGIPRDSLKCPLAIATGYWVGVSDRTIKPHSENWERLTLFECTFIHLFDNGKFPDIIL